MKVECDFSPGQEVYILGTDVKGFIGAIKVYPDGSVQYECKWFVDGCSYSVYYCKDELVGVKNKTTIGFL